MKQTVKIWPPLAAGKPLTAGGLPGNDAVQVQALRNLFLVRLNCHCHARNKSRLLEQNHLFSKSMEFRQRRLQLGHLAVLLADLLSKSSDLLHLLLTRLLQPVHLFSPFLSWRGVATALCLCRVAAFFLTCCTRRHSSWSQRRRCRH